MTSDAPESRPLRADLVFLGWFALAKVLLQLPWLGRYGFHRDELYFLSCGARPDLGYADLAPLVAWVAALSHELFGDSVVALRILPMLSGALLIVLTGLLARAFGGGRFAMAVAALSVLFAPVFLRTGNVLALPSFEPLFWTACALCLARLVRQGSGPAWLAFGCLAGMGLLNKHSMLLFGFGVAVGLVLTCHRRQLATKWIWLGAMCALLVFLPNLIWQIAHGWPTVTFVAQLNERVMSRISRVEFLAGQVIYHGPLSVLVWVAGLGYLLFGQNGRFRLFAWIYLTVIGTFLLTKAKIYYASPVYPILFAAGGVAWQQLLRRRGPRVAFAGAIAAAGLAFAPLSLPILPIDSVDGYARAATLGLVANSHEVTGDLHDQFGWREHAAAFERAYQALSPDDRERCFFWGGNYGEAGALELFVEDPARPPVAGNHLSWHFWGPPPGEWRTALAFAWRGSRRRLESMFEEVVQIGTSPGDPNAMERNIPILLCRRPRGPLAEVWPADADF